MIGTFFTISFTNYRQGDYIDGKSSRAEVGTFKGHLQQADPNLIENIGLSFTSGYSIWCAVDTDVKVGDEVIADNSSYNVKAINKRDYGGNQHLQVFVEKNEDYASV